MKLWGKFKGNKNAEPVVVEVDDFPGIMEKDALMLMEMIRYLHQEAMQEEGLYRKEGPLSERKAIVKGMATGALVDLKEVSVHSIACAVKYVLRQVYAPLFPYAMHDELIKYLHREDAVTKYKQRVDQLPLPNQMVLKALLEQLFLLTQSPATKMGAKSLGMTVGVNLSRRSEKDQDNTVESFSVRQDIGKFLIENYKALFPEKATEIPKEESEMTALKVSWKLKHVQFTEEELEKLFSTFGVVEMVGINKKGNRAIVMFGNEQDAMKALEIEHQHLRVELNKKSKKETGLKSQEMSVLIDASVEPPQYEKRSTETMNDATGTLPEASLSPRGGAEAFRFLKAAIPHENDDHVIPITKSNSMILMDFEEEDSDKKIIKENDRDQTDPVDTILETTIDLQESEGIPTTSPDKDDLDPVLIENDIEAEEELIPDILESSEDEISENNVPSRIVVKSLKEVDNPVNKKEADAFTKTSPMDLYTSSEENDDDVVATVESKEEHYYTGHSVVKTSIISRQDHEIKDAEDASNTDLQNRYNAVCSRLKEVYKYIENDTTHRSIIEMNQNIQETLKSILDNNVLEESRTNPALELVQIEIMQKNNALNAELVATRELMNIERGQQQVEAQEWEKELISARLARQEAEKLSASLRNDLRKCRSQLACQVSATVSLKREHADLKEKMAQFESDHNLSTRENAHLSEKLEKMKDVAAKTQQRLESMRMNSSKIELPKGEMDSAIYKVANIKKDMTERLSQQIQETKRAIEGLSINDGLNDRAHQQRCELSNLLEDLGQKDATMMNVLQDSRNELYQFRTSVLPETSNWNVSMDQAYLSSPIQPTNTINSIEVANVAMRAFELAMQ